MFYLIEIAAGDSKIAGKAVYAYDTATEAVASFHSRMGSAMKSELYTSELLLVIDESGKVLKREKYAASIPAEEDAE